MTSINSYVFQHRGAILRDFIRTKEYKSNMLNQVSLFHGTYWSD